MGDSSDAGSAAIGAAPYAGLADGVSAAAESSTGASTNVCRLCSATVAACLDSAAAASAATRDGMRSPHAMHARKACASCSSALSPAYDSGSSDAETGSAVRAAAGVGVVAVTAAGDESPRVGRAGGIAAADCAAAPALLCQLRDGLACNVAANDAAAACAYVAGSAMVRCSAANDRRPPIGCSAARRPRDAAAMALATAEAGCGEGMEAPDALATAGAGACAMAVADVEQRSAVMAVRRAEQRRGGGRWRRRQQSEEDGERGGTSQGCGTCSCTALHFTSLRDCLPAAMVSDDRAV